MWKLKADRSHVMLAIIRCRNFDFQFATQKYKDKDTENYNFACGFVCVHGQRNTKPPTDRLNYHTA